MIGALPKGLKWDTSVTRRRLEGANLLIVPPRLTAGLGDIFALLAIRRHFRSRSPLEEALPAELRARFLADRAMVSSDPRAYSGWTPLAAALLMVSDFRRQARLERTEPAATIERLALARGIRVSPAGAYRAVPLLRAAQTNLAGSGIACMADALDEIEAGPARLRTAAQAWASGDVSSALTEQRGYEKCLASLPEGADVVSRAMTDTTSAIAAALGRGGHSVAIVNMRTLVAQGGVLQRLQAQGYRVTTPGE
jgi:hypothetical protein